MRRHFFFCCTRSLSACFYYCKTINKIIIFFSSFPVFERRKKFSCIIISPLLAKIDTIGVNFYLNIASQINYETYKTLIIKSVAKTVSDIGKKLLISFDKNSWSYALKNLVNFHKKIDTTGNGKSVNFVFRIEYIHRHSR